MSNEIIAIKLATGEELIAECLGSEHSVLTEDIEGAPMNYSLQLRRPHVVVPAQNGLMLIPWTLCNPEIEKVSLPERAYLLTFKPSDAAVKRYLELTSSIKIATTL